MAATLTLALVAGLSLAGTARAQEEFCALLTPDEVAEVLGGSVAASGEAGGGCTWSSDSAEGEFIFLAAYWDALPFDEREAAGEGVALTVGGRDAWFVPGANALYIRLDGGVLTFQNVGSSGGIDQQAALTRLGEIAVPRSGPLPTLPPLPTLAPQPSFETDADLEARFPADIGGEAVTVQSMTGEALLAMASDQEESQRVRQQLEDALASNGKGIADVTLAFGGFANGSIQAIRVAGSDARVLLPLILPIFGQGQEMTQTPGQVAGKDVVVATIGGSTQHVYARDDVIWVVIATEPYLTHILQALP